MSELAIYAMLDQLDEDVLLDALPPSFVSGAPKRRLRGTGGRFMSSPVAAAVLSGVVAIGVLIAIVLAGRGGPDLPPSPAGSTAGTVSSDESATPDETTTPAESETIPSIQYDGPPMELPAGATVVSMKWRHPTAHSYDDVGDRFVALDTVDMRVATVTLPEERLGETVVLPATVGLYIDLVSADGMVWDSRLYRGFVSLFGDEVARLGVMQFYPYSESGQPDTLIYSSSFLGIDVVSAAVSDQGRQTYQFRDEPGSQSAVELSTVEAIQNGESHDLLEIFGNRFCHDRLFLADNHKDKPDEIVFYGSSDPLFLDHLGGYAFTLDRLESFFTATSLRRIWDEVWSTRVPPQVDGMYAVTPSEGLEFTLAEDGQSYIFTGIGTWYDHKPGLGVELILPDSYNGLPVTAIADGAFDGVKLYYLIFPRTVTQVPANLWCESSFVHFIFLGTMEEWYRLGVSLQLPAGSLFEGVQCLDGQIPADKPPLYDPELGSAV